MRKLTSLLALTALAASAFAAAPVPRKAPEFVIQMPDGNQQLLLSSYKGKVVVLALMFTTCSHCQQTSTYLSTLQKEYAAKGQPVQILGATWDDQAKTQVKAFDAIFAKGFPCGYTSRKNVLDLLGQPENNPPFVPVLLFIDKTGTIRVQHMVTGDDGPESPEQKWFGIMMQTGIKAEIDKLLKTR